MKMNLGRVWVFGLLAFLAVILLGPPVPHAKRQVRQPQAVNVVSHLAFPAVVAPGTNTPAAH
jgi:hypothetical protein